MKKLYGLLFCLLVSSSMMMTAPEGMKSNGDIPLCAIAILGTEIANQAQVSALRKGIREYPEQTKIYEDGIRDLHGMSYTTKVFNGLTILGMIVCRCANVEPYLTGLAALCSIGSAVMMQQKRMSIEEEADIERSRNARSGGRRSSNYERN